MAAEGLKALANAAYSAGNFEMAALYYTRSIDALKMAAGEGGEDLDLLKTLFSNRSATNLQVKRYVEAMVDAKECIACDAAWMKGHLRLGDAAFALGLYVEAVSAYREAKRLDMQGDGKNVASIDTKLQEAELEEADMDVKGPQTPTILPCIPDPSIITATSDNFVSQVVMTLNQLTGSRAVGDKLIRGLKFYDDSRTNLTETPALLVDATNEALATVERQRGRQRSSDPKDHGFDDWTLQTLSLASQEFSQIAVTGKAPTAANASSSTNRPKLQAAQLDNVRNRLAANRSLFSYSRGSPNAAINPTSLDRLEEYQYFLYSLMSRVQSSPEPSRLVIFEAVIELARCIAMLCVKLCNEGNIMELTLESQRLQTVANTIAWIRGGWKRSPEAVGYRGMSFYLRGLTGEAVKDLSNALNMPNKAWTNPATKIVLEGALGRCRGDDKVLPPRHGNYLPLSPSGLGGRYAAATYQIGSKLYMFGGMRAIPPRQDTSAGADLHWSSVSRLRRIIEPNNIQDLVLNDLVSFDFTSNSWEVIEVRGMSPPPRSHGFMTSHPTKPDTLVILGGMPSLRGSREHVCDMWEFNLRSHSWTDVTAMMKNGCPLDRIQELTGHAVVGNKWFIVSPRGEGKVARVDCCDLASGKWSAPRVEGTGPNLVSRFGTAMWLAKQRRLYLWAILDAPGGVTQGVYLWALEISADGSALKWVKTEIKSSRNSAATSIYGHQLSPFGEASSCVCQQSQRAYVFGGWHDCWNWFGTVEGGQPITLNGRYSNILVEIDFKQALLRVVEAAGYKYTGPSLRAQSVIGCLGNSIFISGGYTTLDLRENTYGNLRCFADEWLVRMLSSEEYEALHNAPSAGGSSGSGNGTTSSSSSSSSTPKPPFIFHFSPRDVVDNAERALSQSPSWIQRLCEYLPNPGACTLPTGLDSPIILINCTQFESASPHSFEVLFSESNLEILPLRSLLAKYVNVEKANPTPIEIIKRGTHPNSYNKLYVYFYCDFLQLGVSYVDIHHAEGHAPAFLWGFYARDVLVGGNSPPSSALNVMKPADPATLMIPVLQNARIDACSNPACENLALFRSAEELSRPPPKLLRCSRCLLAQYCSVACQKAHWSQHKRPCAAASAGGV